MTHHIAELQAVTTRALGMAVSTIRRSIAAKSLRAFAMTYLPAHFRCEPSPMHEEIFQLLESLVETRSQRWAIAAPRGHAKTTLVSQTYVLWCICFRREPFILIISNTIDQASDCLSMIKHELQTNELLMEDFPEVCESDRPAGPARPSNEAVGTFARRWRKEEIITRNGVKVTALGAEKKIRGRKHNQHRPTLIILDDVENETEVRSADQRANKTEWFHKAVLKAGSVQTNVIVVGTILHYDSLLACLLNPKHSPGWNTRKYQAVTSWATNQELWERWQRYYTYRLELEEGYHFDGERSGPKVALKYFETYREAMLEGAGVLWPQREDYYTLMVQRLMEGRASFDSEKQNEPVNAEDCYFPEHEMVFWDDEFQTEEQLIASAGPLAAIYGACDPSLGRFGTPAGGGRQGDFSAIISVLFNPRTRVLYVLDADIRRIKPDALIESIIEYHRLRRFRSFAMETNQFQQFLFDEVRRRSQLAGIRIPVVPVNHTVDKIGRIQRLQPLISSGMLRFSRRHVTLLDQLRQFPMAANDDGPDALEMVVDSKLRWAFLDEMRQGRGPTRSAQ